MKECSKSVARRLGQANFIARYFRGHGIDIGGNPDPLSLYAGLFPLIESVRVWDIEDGDAQLMDGVPDASFDFVHASHCLEHLHDPAAALRQWLRIVRPGGYVVVTVPEEDLYEQGVFPSTFNPDHKFTFTMWKPSSWSSHSINVLDLLRTLGPEARIEKMELLDATYRYDLPRYDQTKTPVGECAIEFVLRRADAAEIQSGTRTRVLTQPDPALRVHYNQYVDDYNTVRAANPDRPPFRNEDRL